jgi:hypothetical protein
MQFYVTSQEMCSKCQNMQYMQTIMFCASTQEEIKYELHKNPSSTHHRATSLDIAPLKQEDKQKFHGAGPLPHKL